MKLLMQKLKKIDKPCIDWALRLEKDRILLTNTYMSEVNASEEIAVKIGKYFKNNNNKTSKNQSNVEKQYK